MKTMRTSFVLALFLVLCSCVKIYEHPLDESKKVEVSFKVAPDIEVSDFRSAILDDTENSDNVKYVLFEAGTIIEHGEMILSETLTLNLLPGDYVIKFYNIEEFPVSGTLSLEAVNSTFMNHVYAGEYAFTVASTAISETVVLTRLVSAVQFIKDDSPSSNHLTINSATINSSTEISLFNFSLANSGIWNADIAGWNYVFPGEEIDVSVNITHEPSGNLYTLTRSFDIERNKKYTVIVKRNNLDQGTTDGEFTLEVDYNWAGSEDVL